MDFLDRCGKGRDLKEGSTFRICDEHDSVCVTKQTTFFHHANQEDGSIQQVQHKKSFKLYMPTGEGPQSTNNMETTKTATGLGAQRCMWQILEKINKVVPRKPSVAPDGTALDHATVLSEARAAETRLVLQQYAEVQSVDTTMSTPMDTSLVREAGLPCTTLLSPPVMSLEKRFFRFESI